MPELITILPDSQQAPEEGTFPVVVSFFDEDDTPVTPSAATWTLTNERGTIINNRSAVALSGLSTSKTILVQNDDLIIETYGNRRCLIVEYTYTSSLGSGLRGKSQVNFKIRDFAAVT